MGLGNTKIKIKTNYQSLPCDFSEVPCPMILGFWDWGQGLSKLTVHCDRDEIVLHDQGKDYQQPIS